ncbi:20040_t:CDS:1, partial [Racocetra fulgida]
MFIREKHPLSIRVSEKSSVITTYIGILFLNHVYCIFTCDPSNNTAANKE